MKLKMIVNCHVFIVSMLLMASVPAVLSAQDEVSDSVAYSHFDVEQLLKEVVITAPSRSKVKANSIETRIVGSDLEHMGSAEDVLTKVPGMIKRAKPWKLSVVVLLYIM